MAKEPNWLLRVIETFSNETEFLVCETVLPPIELSQIQSLWDQPENEPMVDCFEVGPKQEEFLAALTGMKFDFSAHSYFISARTTDWEATKSAGGYHGLYPRPTNLPGIPGLVQVKPKSSA